MHVPRILLAVLIIAVAGAPFTRVQAQAACEADADMPMLDLIALLDGADFDDTVQRMTAAVRLDLDLPSDSQRDSDFEQAIAPITHTLAQMKQSFDRDIDALSDTAVGTRFNDDVHAGSKYASVIGTYLPAIGREFSLAVASPPAADDGDGDGDGQ